MYHPTPLRRARQRRGLVLQDVAELTKLSPRLLLKIETGQFDALPPGVQGRAHLRAYARAVGLDADEVVMQLAARLPLEPDPLQALRARVRQRFAEDHPVAAALRCRVEVWLRRAIGLGLDASRWRPRSTGSLRLVAAAFDATTLALYGGMTVMGSAWITSAGVDGVWRAARWPLVVAYGLTTIVYFTVSQGAGRRTPGTVVAGWVSHAARQRHSRPGGGLSHVSG